MRKPIFILICQVSKYNLIEMYVFSSYINVDCSIWIRGTLEREKWQKHFQFRN